MKVWVLTQICRDRDGEEWETLDCLFQEKPTVEKLREKFKYHNLRPNFIEDLDRLGWADSKAWGGWDDFHFRICEEECI